MKRIITIISVSIMLLIGMPISVFAMTGKAGQPLRIYTYPDGGIVPAYHCYDCGNEFDTPAEFEEPERFYTGCPNCGSSDYTSHPNAGQFVGTYLDAVYVYTENPEKEKDPTMIRQYGVNYNTHIFDRSIVINKPGKYYLGYLYTTFYYVGDTQSKEYDTLTVLGQVAFNPNKGKLAKPLSSKWIKQKVKIGKLPKPKRKGYKFLGWYTKKKGGKRIQKSTKVSFKKAKVTYYAHWKKKR